MWRLFYPLNYFRIINREKRMLDLVPTAVGAVTFWWFFTTFPKASFFRAEGFLDRLLTLTSCLTGFYIAALLAAATFGNKDLDSPIRFGAIEMRTRDAAGKPVVVFLSRRQFVCTVFGYLSFSSLLLSVAMAFVIALSKTDVVKFRNDEATSFFGPLLNPDVLHYLRSALIFAFSLSITHLLVASSLGLYYIMERLYKEDVKISTATSSEDRAA